MLSTKCLLLPNLEAWLQGLKVTAIHGFGFSSLSGLIFRQIKWNVTGMFRTKICWKVFALQKARPKVKITVAMNRILLVITAALVFRQILMFSTNVQNQKVSDEWPTKCIPPKYPLDRSSVTSAVYLRKVSMIFVYWTIPTSWKAWFVVNLLSWLARNDGCWLIIYKCL